MAASVNVRSFPGFVSEKGSVTDRGIGLASVDYVVDEHHFVRMLRLERKRTERSGNPFMLMLIESDDLFQDHGALKRLVGSLNSSTRETDTVGWYQTGSALGVLFTEVGTKDQFVFESIAAKVGNALHEDLEIDDAKRLSISYHLYPETADDRNDGTTNLRLYPDLPQIAERKKAAHRVKRALDIFGSLLAIVLLAPLFLLIAAAIKLSSEGPVLFRQKRIGQYGKEFTFLKFRSMRTNNDSKIHEDYVRKLIAGQGNLKQQDGKEGAFKLTNDPRVTPFGRFIRRTSLDELPQFFNVLRGEMSLVGPRPPVRYEYEAYDVWHRHRLMEVKPGITGLWQVTGRSKTTFDDMVRLDLQYAGSWTILTDMKILLQTPMAVVSGSGAH